MDEKPATNRELQFNLRAVFFTTTAFAIYLWLWQFDAGKLIAALLTVIGGCWLLGNATWLCARLLDPDHPLRRWFT